MSEFSKRVAALSPQQRALLDTLLAEKGKQAGRPQTIPRRADDAPAPLSFAQERLWFLDQLTPGSPLYNESVAIRLHGALDVAALERSLNAIVARHEALRTTFAAQPDPANGQRLVQIIAPELTLRLAPVDLATPPDERDAAAERMLRAEAQRPFDLERGPLLRVALLRLAEREHIVLLTVHHSVFDRWSAGVLVQELGQLYAAQVRGQPAALAPLPIQYADYAQWQRDQLSGPALQTLLEYWTRQLADAPPTLDLPTDFARPSVQHNRGARQERPLPPALAASLRELSQREGVTLFMTLLAAFQTLLYRLSGQTNLVIGTRIAGRGQVETEPLIGLFLNALALRADLGGNPTFRALLQRVRETALGAYAHQELPFERLVQALQPERALSRQPLFQVMFALQNTPLPALDLPGLTLAPLNVDSGTAKLDLDFWIIEDGAQLTGVLEYDADLFAPATISRVLDQFQTLLAEIVRDPGQRIATVPIMSASELHELLVTRNSTAAPYPTQCLHELFEAQAARTPDAVAVLYRDQTISYGELNASANRLAHYLRTFGIGPDTPVGVCVERSLTTVVALLAILKAGGCYVPLDPTYPAAHLQFVLDDTRVPVVLAEQRLLDRLPPSAATIVCLERDHELIERQSATNPVGTGLTPDHTFYIMYTSGSTGQPKGVVVAQRQLLNRFAWMWRAYPFAADEIVCQRTNVNFTVSIWELLGPLLRGIRTAIIPDETVKDAPAFVRALAAHEVTRIVVVPSLLRAILDVELDLQHELRRVRLWSVCGEALSRELWQRFRERLPDATLLNQYGASEVNDAAWFDTRGWSGDRAGVPIGRPISNLRIYLLDANLQPVPPGMPGDVYISSVSLARGYLNRPDLTAERFIPDPFSATPGARLYSMGDVARYLPDGNLEHLGRSDQQVKVRGVRVELGGIEALLRQHPAVDQVVVLARELGGETRVAAYVTGGEQRTESGEQRAENGEQKAENKGTREQGNTDGYMLGIAEHDADSPAPSALSLQPSALRAFLAQRLPEYMLPNHIVVLDKLPRTPNGKVDRKALPLPDPTRPQLGTEWAAPRTPTEELLAGIWREVLRVERVGIHDNFFELGGHSLLATQIVARVRDALQCDLPLRALFEAPTIAGLIERVQAEQPSTLAPPITPDADAQNPPLSFAQQRLWFLDQLEPGNPFYNVPAAVRLEGALDIAALERSLNAIVRRHAVLRTTFAQQPDRRQPVQIIAPEHTADAALPIIDLGQLDATARAAEVQRLVGEEARRPFDLERGPLLRRALLRLSEREHVLLITVHHIVSDGWSTQVLVRELLALYSAFAQHPPLASPLAPLPVQYADYARWQRAYLQGAALEQQLGYWRRQLADFTRLELPADRPRPAVQVFAGARESRPLPAALTASLRELSQREGVTLFMTLLAAFQTLLARTSGQDDIVVGSPIAGRTRPETEGLIGFFVNTLALRTDLGGNPSFREALRRVREVCLGAYAHQDLPFEKLVEELHPARDLSQHPFFDVLFNFLDSSQLTLESPGLTLRSIEVEPESKFAITLYVDERGSELGLRLVYQRALFSAERIAALLDQFQHLLEQIVAAPERPLAHYSLVTPAARALLPDPSQPLPEPRYPPVTELIAAWAARMPDQPALRQDGHERTYCELVDRATLLAQTLLAHGLQRGQVVAVAGPRSYGLITSMLAALLSGGVMLTLDRMIPANRQRLMLEAADTACCLYVGAWRAEDDWLRELPGLRIIMVGQDDALTPDAPEADPPALPALTPDDHAYIFFTSGTTGAPKGVLGWHKGISHFTIWQRDTFAIGPQDRSAQLTGLSFNVLLRDVFTPLVSGATLCMPPAEADLGADQVLPWMEREGITMLHTVPTLAQSWLIDPPAAVTLRALRWIFSAGEPLTEALVQRWRTTFPESRAAIVLLYGQTETTLAKCFYQVPATIAPGVQPAGRPLPHTQALVLNRAGQLCGIGEPGEVVIRTPFRTLGYFNAPQEQRQRFVANPFAQGATDPGDLLYFTGDRGRYRAPRPDDPPPALLEILGRADDQIKIRGVRVEPAEVQAWLARHPAVRAAVVTLQDDPQRAGERRLVAYVVVEEPRTGARWANQEPTENREQENREQRNKGTTEQAGEKTPDPRSPIPDHRSPTTDHPSELRAFLRQHVPEAMVPSAFVTLDALPLTANGKVDRRALPQPEETLQPERAAFVAPQTPIEQQVAAIWSAVLERAPIGRYDNFFALGGHSLLATQVVARLRDAFQVQVSLRSLFETPTVAGLAQLIEQAGASAPAPAPTITRLARDRHRVQPSGQHLRLPDSLKQPGRRDESAER
jgi:amino acid adenylation domain-containing protein